VPILNLFGFQAKKTWGKSQQQAELTGLIEQHEDLKLTQVGRVYPGFMHVIWLLELWELLPKFSR
jgi:hypothetical protein